MSAKTVSYKISITAFVLFVLLIAGCTKPPTQEIAKAEKALEEAKLKEAHLYAPDIYKKAEESLKNAKGLVVNKQYKEAKKAAEETVQFAQQAIKMVEPGKRKIKKEAELVLKEVEKSLVEFKTLAAKAIKKKVFAASEGVEGLIGKWEIDLVNIKEKLQNRQAKQAYDDLNAIREEIKSKKEMVDSTISSKPEKK
ncbi:MAG: hypothetical protein A4E64_00841 [Syntrophorhabdus sp. PtaU1.Bin058]|nr:MAG: hypothetical protein A4E64_00841 [Syntrophorhabdus sp. PtaU1.Bin058]